MLLEGFPEASGDTEPSDKKRTKLAVKRQKRLESVEFESYAVLSDMLTEVLHIYVYICSQCFISQSEIISTPLTHSLHLLTTAIEETCKETRLGFEGKRRAFCAIAGRVQTDQSPHYIFSGISRSKSSSESIGSSSERVLYIHLQLFGDKGFERTLR
jgi:hypothetical protein